MKKIQRILTPVVLLTAVMAFQPKAHAFIKWDKLVDSVAQVVTVGEVGRQRDRERAREKAKMAAERAAAAARLHQEKISAKETEIAKLESHIDDLKIIVEPGQEILADQMFLIELAGDQLAHLLSLQDSVASISETYEDYNADIELLSVLMNIKVPSDQGAEAAAFSKTWETAIEQVQDIAATRQQTLEDFILDAIEAADEESLIQFINQLSHTRSAVLEFVTSMELQIAKYEDELVGLKAELAALKNS